MKKIIKNRRKSPDIWIYIARILAVSGWLLFIAAFIVSYYAAPEKEFGLYRYHGIEVRDFWLTQLTGYLYAVLWASGLSSYGCLIIEKYRSRRKSDSKNFNLFLLILICIAWICYLLIEVK